jgi:CHAT domain-containing protein
MLSTVREILPVQASVAARALIVANPCEDLPLAEFEAGAVSSILRDKKFIAQTICGEAAGQAEIASAIAGCGLLHFSGHGLQEMVNPLRSSLLVAPRWTASGLAGPQELAGIAVGNDWFVEDEESRRILLEGKGLLREMRDDKTGDVQRSLDYSEDGTVWIRLSGNKPIQWGELWTAADILVDPRLEQCRVAVLSACSSGVEAIPSIEEPAGVPGALKAAGVRSLVSAFWPVTQELAWLFTAAFYDALGRDIWDLSGAVHSARERVRRMPREEAAARLRAMTTDIFDLSRRLPLDVAVYQMETGPDLPFAEAVHWGAFFLQGDARIRVTRRV